MPADPPHPMPPGETSRDDGEPGCGLAQTVYSHLRAIAQRQMHGERIGHSLSATALVHEAFLRMDTGVRARNGGDGGFYHAAAEAMRRILIEHARARGRVKRGGGRLKFSIESIGDVADLDAASKEDADAVFALDEAFGRLEVHNAEVANVVRLRFYAGLSVAEAARALDVSERTINHRWAYARAWLARDVATNTSLDEQE